jgi:predicted deacylase
LPLARRLNVSVIWVRDSATVNENTLAYNLNVRGVSCLMVEMGVGMGLSRAFTEQLLVGILAVWKDLGVLAPTLELAAPTHRPIVAHDNNIHHLNAGTSGLFVAEARKGDRVRAHELLGRIVSPFEGSTLTEIRSPVTGILFTLRQYPLVYEGSLLARVLAATAFE